MQMSNSAVFAFVEGKRDRYFYGQICDLTSLARPGSYHLILSQELSNGVSGKAALLRFFDYLEGRAALFDDFQGKKTLSVFFLDKDVDDLAGRMKESPHILYTEHYELENYLFRHGDVARAAATAAALDLAEVRVTLGDVDLWRRSCAERWKDWVILCAYTQVHGVNCICNYSVPSQINAGLLGAVDESLLMQHRQIMFQASGLSAPVSDLGVGNIAAEVNRLYHLGKFDSVFKGRWYALFLMDAVRTAARGGPYNHVALEDKLLATLAATLIFSESWPGDFRKGLVDLLVRYHFAQGAPMTPIHWLGMAIVRLRELVSRGRKLNRLH
jgi:hypothetical protein